MMAPLFRGEEMVGLLVVRRKAPGDFATNTVDLIKTFAGQSVLAIQNARLFENVEARTGELAKSLKDLQTAPALRETALRDVTAQRPQA